MSEGVIAERSDSTRGGAGVASACPVLAIVVPCYNEEEVLRETAARLKGAVGALAEAGRIHGDSFIYFVDDGSRDRTWEIVEELHRSSRVFRGLRLSRNVGHQNALVAGLLSLRDRMDCAITVDADLQDDIDIMGRMVDRYLQGDDIVYGVRKDRAEDSAFKKYSALFFYRLMGWMGVQIVYNHADFRLTSRRVVECLADFREVNLFLRGLFPLIGFRSSEVYYNRGRRLAGASKYPLRKMLSFALEGITSFSIVPLRVITFSGVLVSFLTLLMSLWVLIGFLQGRTVPGWASTVLPIYLIGGFQLLAIGLIGEYLGRIYREVKARPRFFRDRELF